MRLDIFLPFLRKTKKGAPPPSDGQLLGAAKRVLPASWFADRVSGKPGWLRRVLKRIGPTVLSSPLRRVVQGACFVFFLLLFFYVCWPYTARPQETLVSNGWSLSATDQKTGDITLTPAGNQPAGRQLKTGSRLHLVDQAAQNAVDGYLAEFDLAAVEAGALRVKPVVPLSAKQLDALLLSPGPWALHNAHPWPSHYTDELAGKEVIDAEVFLIIDPLVALSTSLAARSWVWSLTFAGIILVVCILIPRGFCGYLCPLGTLIDLFDWALGKRVKRFRVPDDGWWVHIKYYLLAATLIASLCGVLVSGYVAAIPVITRGMMFIFEPLQSGLLRGFYQVPALNAGHFLSIGLFLAVLGLGFLRPRFWCRYVCPSGAVFSLGNLLRASERKVESTCINCNKCVEICPFDAIKPDFTTRTSDCTLCQTCGGVCPTQAIKFVGRWNTSNLKVENDPPTGETALGRRGFLSLAAGTAAAVVGGVGVSLATRAIAGESKTPPVRPPGSVPEPQFLDMCIRCGECYKACPFNVLQSTGLEHGLEALWTPRVVADWAGCDASCNGCGQVCPTGAIRALPLAEKRVARMGLAIVNQETCLPVAGKQACDLCVQECADAGYHAIEQRREGTEVDENGEPIEGTGFLVPIVLAEKCVGCGLCQTRCYQEYAGKELSASAIVVEAGPGKEDRLMNGSYRELRAREARRRDQQQQRRMQEHGSDFFIPDAPPATDPLPDADPFFGAPAVENPAPVQKPDDDPFGLEG